jgi:hypothetical protein
MDFQVSLIDVNGEAAAVYDSALDTLSITDMSNYLQSTEPGAQSGNFNAYRRIIVTAPSSATYEFSATTGYNEYYAPPSISNTPAVYDVLEGDGVYMIRLMAVPTYNSGVVYEQGDTVYWVVNNSTNLFVSVNNGNTGNTPSLSPTFWTQVQPQNLSTKYSTFAKVAVIEALKKCWINAVYASSQEISVGRAFNPCANKSMFKADMLDNILSAIKYRAGAGMWDEVEWLISKGKIACNC